MDDLTASIPAVIASEAKQSTAAAEVEAWFVEQIHNSPVSRDTEIYNHVRTAVDALKLRLAAL